MGYHDDEDRWTPEQWAQTIVLGTILGLCGFALALSQLGVI